MRTSWSAYLAEIVGTFLFFFIGMGSVAMLGRIADNGAGADVASSLIVVALAHGVALAVMVSALGPVSGAHFNPAVSFGVWIAGHMPGRQAVAYMVSQLIGGLLAALALRVIFPTSELGLPRLGAGIDPLMGIGIEAILTVVLLIAVFGTAIDPRGPKIGGLFIGLALAADILMGGLLTGAAVNPARWFAPAAVDGIWNDGYVWILGPFIGAALAALFYRFFLLPDADLSRTPADPTA